MATITRTLSAPTTEFQLDMNVVDTDATGYGRWKIAVRLQAWNRGNTNSHANETGYHRARWGNDSNGDEYYDNIALTRSTNPFLPSGVNNGTRRWDVSTEFWISANSNGYWNGTSQSLPIQMTMDYTGNTNRRNQSTLALPRLQFAPSAPGQPTVTSRGETSITISWAAPSSTGNSPITGYRIEYASNSSFIAAQTIAHGTGRSVTLTDLLPAQNYWIRVSAVNAKGDGPKSSARATATVARPSQPAAPVTVAVAAESLGVTFPTPAYVGDGITGREAQLSTDALFNNVIRTAVSGSANWVGLTRATTYYARHRARNEIGWSDWSEVEVATTLATQPSPPTAYSATDIASQTAYSTLPAVADTGGAPLTNLRYQVTPDTDTPGANFEIGSYRAPLMTWLGPGVTYYYRLAVANSAPGGGWSDWGPWVTFTTRSNVPGIIPELWFEDITDTTTEVNWDEPFALNGATLLGYSLRVALNSSFSSGLLTFTTGATTTLKVLDGLLPGTTYYAQAWSESSNGFGSYSPIFSWTTTGTAPIAQGFWKRIAGVWRPGTMWKRIEGVWRQGTMWQRVSGVWRKF